MVVMMIIIAAQLLGFTFERMKLPQKEELN